MISRRLPGSRLTARHGMTAEYALRRLDVVAQRRRLRAPSRRARCLTTSPIEMMPTSWSCSTTGRWRNLPVVIRSMMAPTVSDSAAGHDLARHHCASGSFSAPAPRSAERAHDIALGQDADHAADRGRARAARRCGAWPASRRRLQASRWARSRRRRCPCVARIVLTVIGRLPRPAMRRLLDEPVFFNNGRYCYRVPSRQPLDAAAKRALWHCALQNQRGRAAVEGFGRGQGRH